MMNLQLRIDQKTIEGMGRVQQALQSLEKLLPQRASQGLKNFEEVLNRSSLSVNEKEEKIIKAKTDLEKLGKSAEQFEAYLIKDLIKTMRKSMPTEKLGPMGDMAMDMMDQAIADSFSQRKQFGLSQMLLGDLAKGLLGQEAFEISRTMPQQNQTVSKTKER